MMTRGHLEHEQTFSKPRSFNSTEISVYKPLPSLSQTIDTAALSNTTEQPISNSQKHTQNQAHATLQSIYDDDTREHIDQEQTLSIRTNLKSN